MHSKPRASAPGAWVALLIGLVGVPAGQCETGPDLAAFERPGAQFPALSPLDPRSTQATVDARHFNLRLAQQVAEREMLWVRERIAHHAGEREVRAALDLIVSRQRQYGSLSTQAQDDQALEAAMRIPRFSGSARDFWAFAAHNRRPLSDVWLCMILR